MNGVRSIALLAARMILGIIFIAHGWQKLHVYHLSGVEGMLKGIGAPAPSVSAYILTWAELGGGILLVLGLLLPLVSIVLVVDMIGAIYYTHWEQGFWVAAQAADMPAKIGWEWPLALIAGLLAVGFANAGHFAVDTYAFRRRGGRAVEA
ncbi:DoxX family protein [Gordonia oryzae]|uniref:DoxX family protein n=1 Tax=Gordonia oryzae TaxID=2487349 RepID=A0A3N4G3Y0_9ACTN|nr:DoxX family protein [Gordonia oryzae]RPA57619.1 DoxX family protein [Gordonia oryzae]